MTFSRPAHRPHRSHQQDVIHSNKGFTLLELLITVVILGIILAVAVPEVRNYIYQNRFKGAMMDVLAAVRQARSTAVEKNINIVFKVDVANKSYQVFRDDGAGSADADSNGIPDNAKNNQLDAGEQIVLSGILPNGVTFTGANFGGQSHFHFDNRGFPLSDANILTNGLVGITSELGRAGSVELISSGHSRIQ